MRKSLGWLGRRKTRSSAQEAPSEDSSRRYSVSESPQCMEIDQPSPRGDMLLLGGMRNLRSASMRFPDPHGHVGAPPVPPRRSTRSTAPPSYQPKQSEYGFFILTKDEEDRLESLKERLRPNSTFDDDTLIKLGIHADIYKLLENVGWAQFAMGISVDYREDIALEMLVTMQKEDMVINDKGDEAPGLSFRIMAERRKISYESIGVLLCFNTKAPEFIEVEENELDEFWAKIAIEEEHTRRNMCNIVLQIFHSWMSKRISGRLKEGKVTEAELNWLYCALVKKKKIDPSYIMINRWLSEAESKTGFVTCACYLTLIGSTLAANIPSIPRLLVMGQKLISSHL